MVGQSMKVRAWLASKWHWLLVSLVLVARTATLGLSAWPVHMGYVEAFYANVASGRAIMPDGLSFLPMRYVPLRWSFALFGESEWAARFPGMIALAIGAIAASGVGTMLAGDYGRRWTPVFFVSNPWVLSWYGRAMPDAWLATGLLLTGLVILKSNRRPVYAWLVGPAMVLGLAAKPTGLLAIGLLIMIRRRDAFLISLASIGATVLVASNLATHGRPELMLSRLAQLAALRFGVEERFDVSGMIFYGVIIGCAGVAWLAWARPWSDVTLPLYGFVCYTLWYAIPHHAYYALPIAAWSSVAATPFFQARRRVMGVMLGVSMVVAPIAMWDTGSLGDNRTRIVESFPKEAVVDIQNHLALGPMFEYYRPDLRLVGRGHAADYTVSSNGALDGCLRLGSRHYGPMAIYAYDCTPLVNGGGNNKT